MQNQRNVDFISVDPSPPGVLLESKAAAVEEMANPVVITDHTGTFICAISASEQLTGRIYAEIGVARRRMIDPGRVSDPTDQGHIVVCAFHRSGSWLSRRNRSVHLLILFVMLCIGSVAAQDTGQAGLGGLSTKDLAKKKVDPVYGASKFLQKAEDAATSITVVMAEEVRKYGYRSLADALRSVRGFYVINDRNYSYVGDSNGG
jgi:hypothetical protein